MSRLDDIKDVSFMGDITLPNLKKKALDEFSAAYAEITGAPGEISDENKAILYAAAQIFYQLAEVQDKKARQNLLKYSSGKYLDNLAANRQLTRKLSETATATIRFTLSAARENPIIIPKGTRITSAAANIYFATDKYTEIAPGKLYADIRCVSLTGGSAANKFTIGELNVLADPIAYVESVSNIDEPTGGADEETDDAFAERIFNSKILYTTAGAEAAYIYYAKEYSALISDVVVTNPKDAEINIYVLLSDHTEATNAFLDGLREYLSDNKIRPLTDKVTTYNVERVNYDIDATYTVYKNNVSELSNIRKAVDAAIEKYIAWQCGKIGRDINPQKLISLMIDAGAASVDVKMPQNTNVGKIQIAYCGNVKAEYKGYIEE